MSIGMLVHSLNSPISIKVVAAIEAAAAENGYSSYLVHAPAEKSDDHLEMVRKLSMRGVDGLLIYNTLPLTEEVSSYLDSINIPIVYIGSPPNGQPSYVCVDRSSGVEQLVRYLHHLGHTSVGLAWHKTPGFGVDIDPKIHIFREYLVKTGIDIEWVDYGGSDSETPRMEPSQAGYNIIQKRIRSGHHLPTAILAISDEIAIGILAAANDLGVSIPKDVSLVGFDDLNVSRFVRPQLTTIRQPFDKLGTAAFEMLGQLMSNPDADISPVKFPCELVIRDSTGRARAAN